MSIGTDSVIADYLRAEHEKRAFSAVAYAFGTNRGTLEQGVIGTLTWGGPPAAEDSLWDLASVTKPIVALGFMTLVEDGLVALNDPLSRYLPDFAGTDKGGLTLAQLLTHTAGLPAEEPMYKRVQGPDAMRQVIRETPLKYPPGADVEYTSLGLMLIGWVMEAVTGRGLSQVMTERVFQPVGLRHTGFNPPPEARRRAAATEQSAWRGCLIQGEVHDGNAYALGGAAGHAGLFTTVGDMARLCQVVLLACHGDGEQFLSPATMRRMTANHTAHLRLARCLGWQGWDESGSPGGDLFSADSFGHTGFTGTSLWLDPKQDAFAVLLTNRVHPTRENNAHIAIRPRFHNLVAATVARLNGGKLA